MKYAMKNGTVYSAAIVRHTIANFNKEEYMTEKNCVVIIISDGKRKIAENPVELSREVKEVADAFYKRNGETLKKADLTQSSKK